MRDIPWFQPRRPYGPSLPAKRLSGFLEAIDNEMDTAVGEDMFSAFATVLTGELLWADDVYAPAPYRVVRGWQDR